MWEEACGAAGTEALPEEVTLSWDWLCSEAMGRAV
jgi:hypothetical protein